MATARLSDKAVREARIGRLGDGGRGSYGLSLLVRIGKDGEVQKHWQQRYRTSNGAYSNRGLGRYPEVSLEMARLEAARFSLEHRPNTFQMLYSSHVPARRELQAAGSFAPMVADVVVVDQEVRVPTFREVFIASVKDRSGGFKSTSRTAHNALVMFNNYVNDRIAATSIKEITAKDVKECLDGVWHTKPATAKKMVQHLAGAFNYAIVEDKIDISPMQKATLGLNKLKLNEEHQSALPFAEVGQALKYAEGSRTFSGKKLAFRFVVLTASRTGEVVEMDWNEIDLDGKVWTIPASKTKTNKTHRVPLSDAAMNVLEMAGAGLDHPQGLVFRDDKGKGLTGSALLKFLQTGYPEATMHGFRSSFRDWAAEMTDCPSEICELALGHVEGSAAVRAYRRADLFEKRRDLMDSWADYLIG